MLLAARQHQLHTGQVPMWLMCVYDRRCQKSGDRARVRWPKAQALAPPAAQSQTAQPMERADASTSAKYRRNQNPEAAKGSYRAVQTPAKHPTCI
jgi:hypothetical protein